MRIKTSSTWFMRLCGWVTFPGYVEAEHGLWWQWYKRGRKEKS